MKTLQLNIAVFGCCKALVIYILYCCALLHCLGSHPIQIESLGSNQATQPKLRFSNGSCKFSRINWLKGNKIKLYVFKMKIQTKFGRSNFQLNLLLSLLNFDVIKCLVTNIYRIKVKLVKAIKSRAKTYNCLLWFFWNQTEL